MKSCKWKVCWMAGHLACLLLLASPLQAQTLSGIVRDAGTQAPLSAARVMQVMPDGALVRAETDGNGRFQLPLRGESPFDLLIERFGYAARRIEFDLAAVVDGGAEILLWPAPFVLPEISAELGTERLTWSSFEVTDAGMLPRAGAPYQGCYYLTIEDVVIRDPRLFVPELASRYLPAGALVPYVPGISIQTPNEVINSQLRRDAWPCGTVNIVLMTDRRYRNLPRRHGRTKELWFRRDNPGRDAPVYDLISDRSVRLPPELARVDLLFSVGAPNRLALASPDLASILILSGDGSQERSIDLAGAGVGFNRVTSLGWLADTLWAADGSTGRVAHFPPGAAKPFVRQMRPRGERAGPPELVALQVPRPLAGGRWLVDRALPDATWPRRPEDPPATRHLLAVDSAQESMDLLSVLRPAPEPLVTGLDDIVQPLRDHVLYAPSPDGRHVTIVRRGIDMAVFWSVYSVTRMDASGNTIFEVDRIAPLIQLTTRAFEDLADSLVQHPALVREVPSAIARRTLVRGGMYRPTNFHPPISGVVVGRDGTTWLRWPDERRRTIRWDVLDPAGQPLRTLNLDYRIRILDADAEGVWALVPDNTGKLSLVRYSFRAGR
jgi:hypothetical protein